MQTQQLRAQIEALYPAIGNVLPTERNQIVVAALAMVQANNRGLPTTAVDSPEAYWRAQAQTTVEDVFYALNEVMVFDTSRAISLARSMWMAKYCFVFDMDTQGSWFNETELSFFDRAAGASTYFGTTDVEFLNKHAQRIRVTALQLREIFKENANQDARV
jgi:hypothetical protein